MGVLNVTPDSFSDGGQWSDPDAAIAHGVAMAEAGAGIVDVGGESTRPGAVSVASADERKRVIPIVRELVARDVTVSIDTMHAETALAAVDAGAEIINDVLRQHQQHAEDRDTERLTAERESVKAGSTSSTKYTHYNVLRTIEDMYSTSHAGNAASASDITGIWTS